MAISAVVKPPTGHTGNPQQAKWNRRYQQTAQANAPARVLSDNLHLLPAQGDALELACGLGGNALKLARHGLHTQAWDLSDVAIDRLRRQAQERQLPLQARCVDLDRQPLPVASFDVICISGFLDRKLCPAIAAALKPGGLLFYQTHTLTKTPSDSAQSGPTRTDFLLQQGELLQLFSDLLPVIYREEMDCGDTAQGLRNQAYLVARQTR